MTEILDPPFDCPHCGCRIEEIDEVATVGHVGVGPYYPHSTCPECHKCMGCYSDPQDPSKGKDTVSSRIANVKPEKCWSEVPEVLEEKDD